MREGFLTSGTTSTNDRLHEYFTQKYKTVAANTHRILLSDKSKSDIFKRTGLLQELERLTRAAGDVLVPGRGLQLLETVLHMRSARWTVLEAEEELVLPLQAHEQGRSSKATSLLTL